MAEKTPLISRKTICLISPYIPKHTGGGERYLLCVAEYLSKYHAVTIAVSSEHPLEKEEQLAIREKYESFFSLDLSAVEFVACPLWMQGNFWQRLQWTRRFDVIYYQTDGSLFFSLAARNIVHIQVPFRDRKSMMIDRLKLMNWQVKNTNSFFTKHHIEEAWKTRIGYVHQPFVDTQYFRPRRTKEKIILHVGRFFTQLHSKRQDVLVTAFLKMRREHPTVLRGWKMVCVGSIEDQEYAQCVHAMAEKAPIEFFHECSPAQLQTLYATASIYWHATGYDVDEAVNPEKMEHFGISTIEAMASGCIPIVINKGGQKEIVDHGVNGYLWNEIDGLIEKTVACIDGTFDAAELAENAVEKAHTFNREHFYQTLDEMVGVDLPRKIDVPKVSAVIPNYNGQKLLKKHLTSVLQTLRHRDELVIVDDASSDDSVAWCIETFHLKKDSDRVNYAMDRYYGIVREAEKKIHITVLVNKSNQRFGESCNRGVSVADGDLIFLLNSDVKPTATTVSQLVERFCADHENALPLFAVGCKEIEADEGDTPYFGGKNRLWFERGLFVHARAEDFHSGPTAWVSGGSGMFHRLRWGQLGGFDRSYIPAYWEDIDLSYRARTRGWRVEFDDQAIVHHHHETTNVSTFGNEKMQIMSTKNALLFTWKHATLWQRVQFFFWLPYHMTLTNIRTRGIFAKGMSVFLMQVLRNMVNPRDLSRT